MYIQQVLIRADRDSRSMTFSEFLASLDGVLESAGERIWFGTEKTFCQIPSAEKILPTEAEIVQFHSDPIVQDLLEVASPVVNASLGISGLTSIRKSIVKETLAACNFDRSGHEEALSVEFCLTLAERCEVWKRVSVPGSTAQYFSSLPVDEGVSDRALLARLRTLSDDRLTNGNPAAKAAEEIRAGLLLIHDYLEPSHQISQSIEGAGPDANGDYWHAIMHRREPDFGNSKYWFRRVGEHPCFERLATAARQLTHQIHDPQTEEWVERLTRSGWDSIAAVEFFQEAHRPHHKGTALRQFASCLQMQEMLILLTHCCRQCEREGIERESWSASRDKKTV